ncbi:MAG: TonB-dependent receptor [Gemmatimonadetes bacterium]|nr:TonB-dependent receptor [Gemmatimonadota bacterium]
MRKPTWASLIFALALLWVGSEPQGLRAQGVTTGAVIGMVSDDQGQPVVGAQVQIVNRATGYATGALTRANGLYFLQGLEVGGPYSVLVQSIGFRPVERANVYVTLSQATRVDVQLAVQAVELAGLEVTGDRAVDFSPTRQGVANLVTDTLIRRVPTATRDFLDLVKLTPQVTRPQDGGPSAGGAYNRFNVFTIDGVNQSERFNLGSTGGVPGGSSSGKLISVEAVKEFRVFMSPTDVRQGNFAGMLVNAVTRSGTNEFTGGATYTWRNEDLAASDLRDQNFQLSVKQYGFHLGGPIIRDKLHFFVAPEWQDRTTPATGPIGGTHPVPAPALDRIGQIMSDAYGFDVGGTGAVERENPLTNLFARLDYSISANHRLVLRQLINRADVDEFSRNSSSFTNRADRQNSGFRFGSNAFNRVNKNRSTVLQLYSNLPNGWSNELIFGYNTIDDIREVPVRAPEISLGVPISGTTYAVTFGTEQFSPDNMLEQDIYELSENLSIPFGAHTLTVGGRIDHTHIFNNFFQRGFGVYSFADTTALKAGTPTSYSVGYDNSGTGKGIPADFRVRLYSLYAQDQWAVNDRLTLTYGLRADIPHFLDKPLENDSIFARFQIHTSEAVPETQVLWSPRVGLNYDLGGEARTQARGNLGIFTGPPPYILLANAFANTGLGLVALTCSGAAVPAFTLDVNNLPKACAGREPPAPGAAGTAGVNINDPNFKYPQYFAGSFGFDRQLPFSSVFTFEGLYRKAINGVLIRDRNLKGPRLVDGQPYRDRDGRVLYADTISASGSVTNDGQKVATRIRGVSFSEGLIEVTNQSEDYNFSLSGQLRTRFSESMEGGLAYTFTRARDVQSLTSDRAISNWRNGRQLATSHDDLTVTPSYFERPHRITLFGTYTLPWKLTDVSIFYEGMSGTPFVYVANGDLNGDGESRNDPIYVPRNALDASEMRIGTGVGAAFVQDTAMARAFDEFISEHDCLNEQRGQIMERSSCRSPFQHRLDLSIRQAVPTIMGQRLALQVDIFNFLNFLNGSWGKIELPTLDANFPQQQVLSQVGRNPGPLNESISTFTFNNTVRQQGAFAESTGEANFWRVQMTLRYAF